MKCDISKLTTFVHSPVSKTFGQKQRTLDKKTRMRFCAQTESISPSICGSIKYSFYKLYRGRIHEFRVHYIFFYKSCGFFRQLRKTIARLINFSLNLHLPYEYLSHDKFPPLP